jgi:Uma2 family endonuclease
MERLGNPAIERGARFTYRQYRTWPDDERWELIDGVAWCMSPAPLTRHQIIAGRLYAEMAAFLRGRSCRVFIAPFDVLLPKARESDDDVDTVVQPDISVFCDRSKITERGARGAPDLVVEVLSPSTSRIDQNEKFRLFERVGVREYWVVDPGFRALCVYRRGADGRFYEGDAREPEREYTSIASTVLEGFSIEPAEVFADLDN